MTLIPPPRYRTAWAAPVVLAAHGSRDPRSAATIRRLAERVGQRWPAPVRAAFLDFDEPSIPDALRALDPDGDPSSYPVGGRATVWPESVGPAGVVVIPTLLTSAYHGRIDLPAVLASTGVVTRVTAVLGPSAIGEAPDPLLLAALRRRLSELDMSFDGLVLLAAGTAHTPARSTVEAVASALEAELNVACKVGYASASPPSGMEAVDAVRATGATRIVAASYFLAAGRLHEAAAASAREGGARGVAEPVGVADEVVRLVLRRIEAAHAPSAIPYAARPSTAEGDRDLVAAQA